MSQDVFVKVQLLGTVVRATGTRERGLCSRVDASMFREIALCRGMVGTVRAGERLLPGVCAQMIPQVSGDRGDVGTVRTAVRLAASTRAREPFPSYDGSSSHLFVSVGATTHLWGRDAGLNSFMFRCSDMETHLHNFSHTLK